jgi:hypothetical protein
MQQRPGAADYGLQHGVDVAQASEVASRFEQRLQLYLASAAALQ